MTEKEIILTSILKCSRIDLYTKSLSLTPKQKNRYEYINSRLRNGEPLQYILGETEFMSYNFKVDERVLIPRSETELLIDSVLKRISSKESYHQKILDIGTGSGNISISLAKLIDNCSIKSIDISQDALNVAKENAAINDVEDSIKFVHQDVLDYFNTSFNEKDLYDIIISNPPYIASLDISKLPLNVQKEPRVALDGGDEGLDFYKIIINKSSLYLKKGGVLAMEIGDGQRRGIEELFKYNSQYSIPEFIKDYSSTDRIVISIKK